MILTRAEIEALTGKRRKRAQCRALFSMGVRYAVRPDGSPVVLAENVKNLLTDHVGKIGTREPRLRL